MKRFLLPAAVLLAAATPNPTLAQGMPPTLVETDAVRKLEFHDQITLVGRTEARAASQIVAEVAGKVLRVDALEGVWIRRGEALVTIDSRRLQYVLDAKRAQVNQVKAAADLAEKNLARTEDLQRRALASDGDLDRELAEWQRTQELYQQLLAEQKQLALDLANCTIRAPFDGYTARKLVDVGEGVSAGAAVYEIVDLEMIKVTVDLPERYFGQVTLGGEVAIIVSGGGDPVTGTVTGIVPNANEDTHTFPVIIAVDNRTHALGGGMLVRGTLSLSEVFSSLAVNKDAIVRQGARTMVYTIADGKAAPVPVITGSTSGNMIAVRGEGLAEGMPVVVRGNERIFPGSAVRTAEPAAQPQGEAGAEKAVEGGATEEERS
ncbi:MAG: efflux RND transporter periplasmic adaptor subunit [Candidatus Krumholzibacteria bacterium]|nr:efflux RND transporter periplasmic adaptor subunit [Candidatus Krumholzibacteria bacterium]